mgnify:CR=1 FL=1|tara:strand:- start:1175 stop:1540 length:366 start_codon:yes stop_codon:yes gene_type:complete
MSDQELCPPDEFAFDLDENTQQEVAEMGDTLAKAQHVPREFNRTTVAKSFHDAFALIGGTPRLAFWAQTNETEFYKLYAKLFPTSATSDFELNNARPRRIIHSLPPTDLDGDITEAEFSDA